MAANKPQQQRARVAIELDRVRILRYDFNALCLVEETLGISLATTPNPFALGLRAMRALLYAGLKHDDAGLTPERCGEFFDEFPEEMISRKILQAWVVSLDDGEKKPESDENPPAPSGTGTL